MEKGRQLSNLAGIFVTHRYQLCQVAAGILGSRDRAEDVVQDAYLKVMEVGAEFDVKKPVAYVFRIVRNLAIDHYRRAALEHSVFTAEDEGEKVPSPWETPEANCINRQQLSLVARALEDLPKRTRRAFDLYREGGHTQRDIARMLGVSPTLVNFMIRDALEHCRRALEPRSCHSN